MLMVLARLSTSLPWKGRHLRRGRVEDFLKGFALGQGLGVGRVADFLRGYK